jgi:hypothetical protein
MNDSTSEIRRAWILIEILRKPRHTAGQEQRTVQERGKPRSERQGAVFVFIAFQRRMPIREVAFDALQDNLAECVLKDRLPVVSCFGERLLQTIYFGTGKLEAAITSLAPPNRRQIPLVNREAVEILDGRWIRKATDRQDVRAPLQFADIPSPCDEPVPVNTHLDGRKHGDLTIATSHNAGDWLTAIELPAIVGADRNRRAKEREGIEGRRRHTNDRGRRKRGEDCGPHSRRFQRFATLVPARTAWMAGSALNRTHEQG